MQRLTKRNGDGNYGLVSDDRHVVYRGLLGDVIKRLGAYEDTGMTPEEINHFREVTKLVPPERICR